MQASRAWAAPPDEKSRAVGEGASTEAPPSEPGQPPDDADPRTDKPLHTNRLAKETSPYLLLHAHNPVDWYAWGEEALQKARTEDKLIFLSIGYSSCYWCHVMERESFMDAEIAAYLNEHFVCIKVDREERPDIDEIYMTSLNVLGRRGGWPLTMFLTPDARPFYGGTYFPPRDKFLDPPGDPDDPPVERRKMTGLATVLELVHDLWVKSPDEIKEGAEQLTDAVKRSLVRSSLQAAPPPGAGLPAEVLAALGEQYDAQFGGFGFSEGDSAQPKFPEPSNLLFLLDQARGQQESEAREMLLNTLDQIARGGIRDHLGGGFHRYSTDRQWRIPHFEKTLYDNGQLASVYAGAIELADRDDFRGVLRELAEFVLRELTGPDGEFFSALDAETDAEEGRYYVWSREELSEALGFKEFNLLADVYGVDQEPNFEDRYVLMLHESLDVVAKRRKLSGSELDRRLAPIRAKLLELRGSRQRPLTDTKVLTSWNGIMIRGLADAGRVLSEPRYVDAAIKSADFILKNLRTPEGRLLRTYGQGRASLNAYLDDYAMLADGLIALHQATNDDRWLQTAEEISSRQWELFWDQESDGFFYTSNDHEDLIARSKNPVDSALPSGNAVGACNLVYLGQTLGKAEYLDRADLTIRAFAPYLAQAPAAMPRMVVAFVALQKARADSAGAPPGKKQKSAE